MRMLDRLTKADVEARGFRSGTTLENRVAWVLSKWLRPPEVVQQLRIGRYSVDFAIPAVGVGIEADGWWHRSPEGAAKDAERDAFLRAHGWLVFRVDDRNGTTQLHGQVCRAVEVVNLLLQKSLPAYPTSHLRLPRMRAFERKKKNASGGGLPETPEACGSNPTGVASTGTTPRTRDTRTRNRYGPA